MNATAATAGRKNRVELTTWKRYPAQALANIVSVMHPRQAMRTFHIVAIPTEVAAVVRATRVSPFAGHPAHAEIATGYGPCRLCLHGFAIGVDRRILFTLDPFAGYEPLPLPGPIFIHENACKRYDEARGFPEDLRQHALTLNAYAMGRMLRSQTYVAGSEAEPVVAALLARDDVDYLHVRDTEAGCFDFRIVRASAAR